MLTTASYYWEVLPNIQVNQVLVRVLQGKERTAGLVPREFEAIFKTSVTLSDKQYDITQLNQILIYNPPETANTKNADTSSLKVKIRTSDLIGQIKTIFRKDYRHLARIANIFKSKE